MNTTIRLEKYRPGSANRYTCPNCGKSKCFTRYINTETGEYVADECGKCDHESSCGYHYPPREFYRDHPELKVKPAWQPNFVNGVQTVLAQRKPIVSPNTIEFIQTEFFDNRWPEKSAQHDSTFTRWLHTLPIDKVQLESVIEDYFLGATSYDIYVEGFNYGPATIFWMIDDLQQVHDAKLMAYTCDGHRVQNWGNSMRSLCVRKGIGPQFEQTEKVLFGLHLLNRYPEKDICIVESEKTAIICACLYPQYLWMATGGCGNLQKNKLLPLMNRHLIIFPDSGEYTKWSELMAKSGHHNYHVSNHMEEYPPNTDLADLIIG